MQHEDPGTRGTNRQRTISRLVFIAFVAIAAYFLITEHRAHLFGVLPFLLIAAGPLLHFFHHRGHNHEGGGSQPGSSGGTHQH
jgi:hypothetical protein